MNLLGGPAVPAANRKEFGFGKTPAGGDAVIIFGKEIPVQMAVAIVGGLGALLLYLRARSSASNIVSAGTAPAAAGAVSPSSSSAYDPNAQAIGALQSAVAGINATLAAQTSPTASSTASQPAPGTSSSAPATSALTDLSSEVLSGVGYNPPSASPISPITTPAGSYEWLTSQPAALAASLTGAQLYYQPEPGTFQPTSYSTWANSMPGSTALYAGVPAPAQPLPTSPTASTPSGALVSSHPMIPA